MFVSGFTIARNAVRLDYPVKEAILSILPLCDEFVVAVGNSDDDTLGLIRSINSPKIRIIETVWDDSLREGGRVLAEETNKALDAISPRADWAFYIQADECVHEQFHPSIKKAMEANLNDARIEGLLFGYKHFYGSYDYVADSRTWYRNEIRIVRNDKRIRSYKDAQGFRKSGKKLRVRSTGADIYHYGWVRHPDFQKEKAKLVSRFWHDDKQVEKLVASRENFDYSEIDSLARFNGTHPAVMLERINRKNWSFDHDISKKNFTLKKWFLYFIERLSGWRVGEYKNYKLF